MLKQAVDRSWPTNSSVWLIIQDSPKNLSNFTVTQLKQLGVYFYATKKCGFLHLLHEKHIKKGENCMFLDAQKMKKNDTQLFPTVSP